MGKSEDKRGFLFRDSWAVMLGPIPNEEAGELIKAVCAFYLGNGNKPNIENPIIFAMFKFITNQITEDEEK